jgi:hypothetical protein
VAGKNMSGVTVATIIRSICSAETPAWLMAASAAFVAMSLVASSGAAILRSPIPVRLLIHSSDVSTIFSRSRFVRMRSGT